MIVLILALIFGIAVLLLTIKFMASTSKSKKPTGKVTKLLSALVAIESVVFIIMFIIILMKTLAA